MKQKFSSAWKKSVQRRKQRKFRSNAPLHVKQKFVHATLVKELRKTKKRRSASLKKGDKVKIMRGQFKGKTGKIDRVNVKHSKIYVTGIEIVKKEGTKVLYPFSPSNMAITEMKIDDKMRQKAVKK